MTATTFSFFNRKAPRSKQEPASTPALPANPEVLRAGRVPVLPTANPAEVVWHELVSSLKTENVRFVYSVQDGFAWYIGIRDGDLDGAASFSTRLAAGLPGHALHEGDAAYLDVSSSTPAMLLIQEGRPHARADSRDSLIRFARSKGVPVIELGPEATTEWGVFEEFPRKAAWQRVSALAWVGAAAFCVGMTAVAYAALTQHVSLKSAQESLTSSSVLQMHLIRELETATSQPLAGQVGQLKLAQDLALRFEGKLHYWKLENGKVALKLSLPPFVREQDYKVLGPGVRMEPGDGEVILTLGELKK